MQAETTRFIEASGLSLPASRFPLLAALDRIVARGEAPFLHVCATNRAAIGLYERLGFVLRTPVEVLALVPAG